MTDFVEPSAYETVGFTAASGFFHNAPGVLLEATASIGAPELPHLNLRGGGIAATQDNVTMSLPPGRFGGRLQAEAGWTISTGHSWGVSPVVSMEYARFFRNSLISGYLAWSFGGEVEGILYVGPIRHWKASVSWGWGDIEHCYCHWSLPQTHASIRFTGGWTVTADASLQQATVGFGWEYAHGVPSAPR